MEKDKSYTVSQVSKIAGVSVKTLHHYDEKGLLVPYRQQTNGYRVYTQQHLVRLQQILIYRELDFSIEDTKQLINVEGGDLVAALSMQKKLLSERQQSLSKMINTIEVTMNSIKGKENYAILFEDIPKEKADRWMEISREREGAEVTDKMINVMGEVDEEKMRNIKEQGDDITRRFATTIGQAFDSEEVQAITQEHYDYLNQTRQMFAGLNGKENEVGDVSKEEYLLMAESTYFQDVRELCEHYGEGYAEHAKQAMVHFAKHKLS